MQITEKQILSKTNYGLDIYAHILRVFYPDETVIHLKGRITSPSKNPFRGNAQSLIFEEIDQQFLYRDIEEPTFTGTPFDFAKLHFKIEGAELLQILYEVLNLKFDKKSNKFPVSVEPKKELKPQKVQTFVPKMSFFKAPISNIDPFCNYSLVEIYERIVNDYKIQTDGLRKLTLKREIVEFKKRNFDYACFSGIFTSRSDDNIEKHSGLLAVDFDHVQDIPALKSALLKDEYFDTELLFVSPSGGGIKWIVSIDLSMDTHRNWFYAIKNYVQLQYDVKVDSAGLDVSRACLLPNDPQAIIHPKYLIK